ncbi:MAG: ABC transporter substrate-binding protein [Candidatus Hodarchaeota archaeon]
MKNKIFLLIVTMILIIIFPLVAFAQQRILIGISYDITGWNAPSGRPEKDGALLAVEDWNAKGIFGGKRVDYIFRDDESDPTKAANIAREFVSAGVCAVTGGCSSTGAIGTASVTSPARIPFVHNAASTKANILGPDGKVYSFSCVNYTPQWPRATFSHMLKKGYKKFALAYSKAAFGEAIAEEVRTAVAEEWGPKHGMEIVYDVGIDLKAPDISSEVIKIHKSKPSAVWCGLYAGNQAAFLRGLRVAGWSPPPPMYVISTWVHEVMQVHGGELLWGAVGWGGVDISRKDVQALNERFKKKYGYQNVGAMLLGYESLNLVLQAIDKVGPDPLKIRDALETTEFHLLRGKPGAKARMVKENYYSSLKPEDHVFFRVNKKGEEIYEK